VKKITSFSQVLKKMRTKANWFFFFLAVYILSWAVSCVFCSFDLYISVHTHTHTHTGPFFRDYPGEPVPER